MHVEDGTRPLPQAATEPGVRRAAALSSYSLRSVSGPLLRSSLRAALNMLLFPLSSTRCSKLLTVKEDLLGRYGILISEWYHPFGIGIGTNVVFCISVPDSTAGSTEIPNCRISFDIPSSAILIWSHKDSTLLIHFRL